MLHTWPMGEEVCGWCYQHSKDKPSRCLLQPSEFSWFTPKIHHGIPDTDFSTPLLDTMYLPNKDHSIWTSIYRKQTHNYWYLDWNSNQPIWAKSQYSLPQCTELKWMFHPWDPCQRNGIPPTSASQKRNNYPDWIIKEPEKKPPTPIINPETGLEVKNNLNFFNLCSWPQWRI